MSQTWSINRIAYCNENLVLEHSLLKIKTGALSDLYGGEMHLLEHIVAEIVSSKLNEKNFIFEWNAYTEYSATYFEFAYYPKDSEQIQDLIIETIFSITCKDIENMLEQQKKIIKEEISFYQAKETDKLYEELLKSMFQEIQKNELGTYISLEKITSEHLYHMYKQYYNVLNCDFSVYGKKSENSFDVCGLAINNYQNLMYSIKKEAVFLKKLTKKDSVLLMFGIKLDSKVSENPFFKHYVDYYFGTDKSFMWTKLRQEMNLIYSFNAGYRRVLDNDIIVICLQCKTNKEKYVIDIVNQFLSKFNITSDMVKIDFNNIIFNFIFNLSEDDIPRMIIEDQTSIKLIEEIKKSSK